MSTGIVQWDAATSPSGVVLTDNNLSVTTNSTIAGARSTLGKSDGKWYCEFTVNSTGGSVGLGVIESSIDLKANTSPLYSLPQMRLYQSYTGNSKKYPENTSYGSGHSAGDVISILLDLDNGTLEYWKNGVSMGVSHHNLLSLKPPLHILFSNSAGTQAQLTSTTANFGATPFKHSPPIGFSAYNQIHEKKSLIYNNFKYLTFKSNKWEAIANSSPTEQDYLLYGIDNISLIPESAWKELSGTVELCYYTENTSQVEVKFNIETDPFTLEDVLQGKTISIIEYTDNPSQTESSVVIETEPFTFYDEMGDSFDLLYYTDELESIRAELEITANHTPLDEVQSDFDLVTWTEDAENLSMSITGIPYPKYRYKVELSDPDRVIQDWSSWTEMDVSENVMITPSMFNTINPSVLTVTVEQIDGTIVTATGTVAIYDTEPRIFATYLGNTLHVKIGDDENDRVQYKVSLNGKQVYPDEGFTPLYPSPVEFTRVFYSHEIKINQQNTIDIVSRDEYGKESSATLTFRGEYSGLLFTDENGDYYSNEFGELLKYLDFGAIFAGQITMPKKVRLINKNGYTVGNVSITLDAKNVQGNTKVEMSKSDAPFVHQDVIHPSGEYKHNEEIPIFVRVVTTKDDDPQTGTFEIQASADPV